MIVKRMKYVYNKSSVPDFFLVINQFQKNPLHVKKIFEPHTRSLTLKMKCWLILTFIPLILSKYLENEPVDQINSKQ